jgi:hypothetical protein
MNVIKAEAGLVQDPDFLSKYLTASRRLRLDKHIYWPHHRGGWRHVVQLVHERLHTPDGVRFVSAVEDELFVKGQHYTGPITEPWVGFIHQMPRQHLNFPDLERLTRMDDWKESLAYCCGLWTLTDYQKNFLLDNDVPVPVAKVYYPMDTPGELFSFEKFLRNPRRRLLFIGEFLRNYQPFFDLVAPGFEKSMLRSGDVDSHMRKLKIAENDSVSSLYNVDDHAYDQLLTENIVFLNLFDAGAVTTVVECVVRGTPILVNKVGGLSEYLGEDYPLYYETLEEATAKLRDLDLLQHTAARMRDNPLRAKLTDEHFLFSLQNTAIYRELPLPRSQQRQFKSYDVSLIICSYKRVYNLHELLTRLAAQDFAGSYEVLIWNNNIEAADEVAEICAPFMAQLSLKLMHSTENFYCQIRPALASLIRSDLLLICDDDVLPESNYISTFVDKYREYGPEAVICARGHIFQPHAPDEEQPQRFWENFEAMRFYDEHTPDRQIHFLHADNCLIPKSVMKRALQHEMERYEFMLIDDYWLSYILSARLRVPIWKIKADGALQMTECADDPSIALFHNPLVNEQRVNFYLYHTRRGWPSAADNTDDTTPPPITVPAPPADKPQRLDPYEQMALALYNREATVEPSTRSAFYLRFAASLVQLQQFFLTEAEAERPRVFAELNEMLAAYKSLELDRAEVLKYLEETTRYIAALLEEPTIERHAWQDEALPDAHAVPAMQPTETLRYFKWLGRQLQGYGEVVELGCWLGAASIVLGESLAANDAFRGRHIYGYDTFRWTRWMERFVTAKLQTRFPQLSDLRSGDDTLPLYKSFGAAYQHLIQPVRGFLYTQEEQRPELPPLAWHGAPVELLIYDLDFTYDKLQAAWKMFAPSFIPHRTIFVISPYGKPRAEGVRRFYLKHAHELRALHKPASTCKAFLFVGEPPAHDAGEHSTT